MKPNSMRKTVIAAAAAVLALAAPAEGGGSSAAAAAKPAAAAVSGQAAAVKAESIGARLLIGGKLLRLETGKFILMEGGRVYVPLRTAATALKSSVVWDGKARSISLWMESRQQAPASEANSGAGAEAAGVSAPAGHKLSLTKMKASFYSDGRAVVLPQGQSAYIADGSLYVPLRFLAELAGAAVRWTSSSQLIEISLPAAAGSGGGTEAGLSGPADAGAGSGTAGTSPGSSASPPSTGAPAGEAPDPGAPSTPSPLPGTPSTPAPSPGTPPAAPISPGVPAPPVPSPTPTPSLPQKDIQKAAEDQLSSLQIQCQNRLMDVVFRYVQSGSDEEKNQLRAEGEAVLAECDSSFEAIMADTKAKLEAGGYSTEVLASYRSMYEEQKASGKKILEDILGNP